MVKHQKISKYHDHDCSLVNVSIRTKCVSLDNQRCMIQLTIIKLHPNEYIQGLHYYPFVVNLGRCTESCNTLDDLLNREWVPNKRERLNLNVFDIIIEINK